MANSQEGEVSIRLDKTRTLKFGMRAIGCMENASDLTINDFMKVTPKARKFLSSAYGINVLLWAGLLDESPQLTIEEAAALFDAAEGDGMIEKMRYVEPLITKALMAGLKRGLKKKLEEFLEEKSPQSGAGTTGDALLSASSA